MNGKRAKQIRKAQGISIQARRDQRVFERVVASAIEGRTEDRYRARRARRQFYAWLALAFFVAASVAAIVSVVR